MESNLEYLRQANLIIGANGQGVEVSDLRISFRIVKTVTPEPNMATIKVYNFSVANEAYIKSISSSEGTDVILNAGYDGATRIVFQGSIKNAYRYREHTNIITEIEAGDGDKDLRNSYMNLTLGSGTTDTNILQAAVKSFANTTMGTAVFTDKRRSKGRAIYAPTKHVLDTMAKAHGALWSIQDGQLYFVHASAVLPNEAIVVNSQTGMLQVPELTDKGIIVKNLLNPQFRCNGVIKLNNNDIKFKPRTRHVSTGKGANSAPITKPKLQVRLDPDGLYKVIRVDMRGDTRGENESWTSDLTCIGIGQPIPQDAEPSDGGEI
jgi:hypothetical protein